MVGRFLSIYLSIIFTSMLSNMIAITLFFVFCMVLFRGIGVVLSVVVMDFFVGANDSIVETGSKGTCTISCV